MAVCAAAALFVCAASGIGRENSSALYKQAAALALNGKVDEGITLFKKVISLSPNYCLGHYGLGKAYLYKYGMTDRAVKHLRISVELDRSFYKGFFYLGTAYFISKKYSLSIAAFKECYALSKKAGDVYAESLYNISMAYDIIGKTRDAKIYFNLYKKYKNKAAGGKDDPFLDFLSD